MWSERASLRDQHGVAVHAGARRASDSAVVRRLLDEVAFEVKHLDAVVLAVGDDDLVAVWVAADVVRQATYAAATISSKESEDGRLVAQAGKTTHLNSPGSVPGVPQERIGVPSPLRRWTRELP